MMLSKDKLLISFFVRSLLVTIVLAVAAVLTTSYFLKNEYEKSLAEQIDVAIDAFRQKYNNDLDYEFTNNKEAFASDVRQIMSKMNFLLLEIYDTNHKEIINVSPNNASFDLMLKNIKENHDNLIIHSFPKSQKTIYNFFLINEDRFMQVFYPIVKDSKVVGYIEGIFYIEPQAVEHFRRGLQYSIAIVILTVLILCILLFPLFLNVYKRLKEKQDELLISNLDTIRSLGNAIAQRDSDTDEHNYRVTLYSCSLAEQIGLNNEEMKKLIKGSFLHDIGKIGITDTILLKQGKLTVEEFEIMKTHVEKGISIIDGVSWLEDSKDIILYHHEKYNGAGYMNSLSGDNIPLVARIFAIADVFDALTSKRPYKEPFSLEKAVEIINQDSGTHFDPVIVEAFNKIITNLYSEINSSTNEQLKQKLYDKISRYF